MPKLKNSNTTFWLISNNVIPGVFDWKSSVTNLGAKIQIFSLIKIFKSTKSISNQWQIFSLSQPSDLQQALQVHFLHLVTELKKLKLLTMQSREDFLMTDGLGNSNKEAAYDISRKICK